MGGGRFDHRYIINRALYWMLLSWAILLEAINVMFNQADVMSQC